MWIFLLFLNVPVVVGVVADMVEELVEAFVGVVVVDCYRHIEDFAVFEA